MPVQFHIQPAKRLGRLPSQFFAKLTQQAARRIAMGHDVINLGQGNPDLPTPSHIVSALQEAIEDPSTHRYSPFRGIPELREAICAHYAREYGVDLDPEQEVAILFGGKAGLVEISQCLLEPGDIALVPDPGYPDYWSGIALAGAQMEVMPLLEDHQFLPDFYEIPKDVRRAAKLMFLNYPNNPTGATANEEFFQSAVAFAKESELVIAHDFAYGAIGFLDRPISFLQIAGAKDVGVEFYTLSKSYNMAGWRVGFVLGNARVISMINELQDHLFVSLFPAVQRAAIVALNGDQSCVKQLVQTYAKRQQALLAPLDDMGYSVKQSKGSFFVWMKTPQGISSEQFSTFLLEHYDVVVAPGIGFGARGEGYVRIALLETEQRLREAGSRIARALNELKAL
ncbi:LL-diaminopimelate aminotransferase [Sulfoacidibacillus thermotolerans]|uniref:LL-diaminopimelate aminotransferase n=2 Tax=Sulfoacidibacillus thermotolerans TaxID=1765684 RepID=A0A2U3DCL7_SULT2|nr:LL-diaminopimelate aminotransferase [Sulfoacidibacillus thermotolerans]